MSKPELWDNVVSEQMKSLTLIKDVAAFCQNQFLLDLIPVSSWGTLHFLDTSLSISFLFYAHVEEAGVAGAEITVVTYEKNTVAGSQLGGG